MIRIPSIVILLALFAVILGVSAEFEPSWEQQQLINHYCRNHTDMRTKRSNRMRALRNYLKGRPRDRRSLFTSQYMLGPIIGQVSETRSKILVEVLPDVSHFTLGADVKLEIDLIKRRGPYSPVPTLVLNMEKTVQVGTPASVDFFSLQSATQYEVFVRIVPDGNGNGSAINIAQLLSSGSFRTLPERHGTKLNWKQDHRIGFTSCNNYYDLIDWDKFQQDGTLEIDQDAMAAWDQLYYVIKSRSVNGRGGIDILVHLGDQVYMDDSTQIGTWQEGVSIWNNTVLGEDERRAEILEIFKQEYRRTWSIPAVHRVLRSVSNVMIWDDHEIRDDWNSPILENHEHDDSQHEVALLARQVFWMYQRALRFDQDYHQLLVDAGSGHEGYEMNLLDGEIVMRILDERSSRTFATVEFGGSAPGPSTTHSYLGDAQWTDLEHTVRHTAQNASVLIIASTLPFIWGNGPLADYLQTQPSLDDTQDHYIYGANRADMGQFFDVLREWYEAKPGRQVVIASGDVHASVLNEVSLNGEPWIKQLVTSPIGTTPNPPELINNLLPLLLSGSGPDGQMAPSSLPNHQGEYYSLIFDESSILTRRNFGVLDVNFGRHGDVHVDREVFSS